MGQGHAARLKQKQQSSIPALFDQCSRALFEQLAK